MLKKILVLITLCFSISSFAGKAFIYDIPDMVCNDCAEAITKEILKLRNLKKENIKFDIKKKRVSFNFPSNKPLTPKELKHIQIYAGYDLIQKK